MKSRVCESAGLNFKLFKLVDFQVKSKECPSQLKKNQNILPQAIWKRYASISQKQLAKKLNIAGASNFRSLASNDLKGKKVDVILIE